MVSLCVHARETTGMKNLCLSGGVALNCVANSKILEECGFENVWVFPAAGDAGSSVGAALFVWHSVFDNPRPDPKAISDVFWGPSYSDAEIGDYLSRTGIPFETYDEAELPERVAGLIAEQNVVGWFQGRMEFGPRALGHRSILADPRKSENWQRVNQKIKFRESFRPFAPAVLESRSSDYFDAPTDRSRFMLFTARSKTDLLPAVTHVDGSSRIQTVPDGSPDRFARLLESF